MTQSEDVLYGISKLRGMHGTKNLIYVFPEKELRGLSPNSYNQVSVSDLYIPRISPHIWLQQNRPTDPGNKEAAQFHCWECIKGNQALDSHRPFICSMGWHKREFLKKVQLQCGKAKSSEVFFTSDKREM